MTILAEDILTTAEVAEALDCTTETLERQTRAGMLPAVKFGRAWVYPKIALLQVLNELAVAHVESASTADTPPAPASDNASKTKRRAAAEPRTIVPSDIQRKRLLDTREIAELLSLSHKHVTDWLTKAPGFPAPVVNLNRVTKRWATAEVLEYARHPKRARG
jgi:excisionase family DNA binding protein